MHKRPPYNFAKIENFMFPKFCLEKFRIFDPPAPPRSENSIVCHAEICLDRFFSVARRGFFSQGLFFGPMSSLPAIYSIRFGVKTLHPTRYRPPAMTTGHPQKRTTMWAALWEKRPMVAITVSPLLKHTLGLRHGGRSPKGSNGFILAKPCFWTPRVISFCPKQIRG